MLLCGFERQALRVAVDLHQSIGQRAGIVGQLGAAAVGFVFTPARDRQLNEHCRDRREDEHQYRKHWIALVAVTPTEEHPEMGKRGYRTRDGRRDRGCQDVSMLDMRELVSEDCAQFPAREQLKNAGGRGNGGVLRVATGRKGIGLRLVDEVDPRHGKARTLRQFGDNLDQLRCR